MLDTSKLSEADYADIGYWTDHPSDSFRDYLDAHVTPEILLGFSQIVWREVIEAEGRVFWADGFTVDGLLAWKESETYRRGGMAAVQQVMNHVHIDDLFHGVSAPMSLEASAFIAATLGVAWKGRLEYSFPRRRFVLVVDGDEVSFYEP